VQTDPHDSERAYLKSVSKSRLSDDEHGRFSTWRRKERGRRWSWR
jgi:hypothetical protein